MKIKIPDLQNLRRSILKRERVVNNHFYSMVHKKEEGTYHRIEKLMKEMPGFLSPRKGLPLHLIPEYSGINKEQKIHDRSKTAHRKPHVKCFLTLFESSNLRIRVSVSASVIPMNIQDWYPLGLTGLISLLPKRLRSLLQCHNLKASILQCSAFFMIQLSHPYMTIGKTILALTMQTFVGKVMSLPFNTLSRFVIAFLPRRKYLLISWLPSLSSVIFGTQEIKSVKPSTFSPSICQEVMGLEAMIFVFWMLS